MVVVTQISSVFVAKCVFICCFVLITRSTDALNLGLIAGDLKHHTSPLLIKKDYHHSPVFINLSKDLALPKLPKPPPSLRSSLFPKPLLLPLIVPPLLPIIPPVILPPLLPKPLFPILPPILPGISPLTRQGPLSPLKVPILRKKSLLGKVSDFNLDFPSLKKDGILNKLKDLRKKGSLTTAEFLRFKKLLLRK